MTHVESQGRHYSEHTDFVAELREADERLRALLRRELARPEPDDMARLIARRYPEAV